MRPDETGLHYAKPKREPASEERYSSPYPRHSHGVSGGLNFLTSRPQNSATVQCENRRGLTVKQESTVSPLYVQCQTVGLHYAKPKRRTCKRAGWAVNDRLAVQVGLVPPCHGRHRVRVRRRPRWWGRGPCRRSRSAPSESAAVSSLDSSARSCPSSLFHEIGPFP